MPNQLQSLAALARVAIDNSRAGSAADGLPPDARAALDTLAAAINTEVGPAVGEWAITRWILTRRPIMECIDVEQGPIGMTQGGPPQLPRVGAATGPAGVRGVHHAAPSLGPPSVRGSKAVDR